MGRRRAVQLRTALTEAVSVTGAHECSLLAFPSFDMVVVICRVTSIDNPCVVGSSPTTAENPQVIILRLRGVAQLVERRTTVPYITFSTTINEGAIMPLFLLTFNTFTYVEI